MNYTYTIRRSEPKHRLLSVIYHFDGREDFFKNFNIDDFSQANIQSVVDEFAPSVIDYWDEYDSRPGDSEVAPGDEGTGKAYKTIREDQPSYDPAVETLEGIVTVDEAAGTKTNSWKVVSLPVDEQIVNLVGRAKADRKAKEAVGAVWADADGAQFAIDTAQDSQGRFSAAMAAIANGMRPDGGRWKMAAIQADGTLEPVFRPMSNAELSEVSGLVMTHVQRCFDAESAAADKIKAGDLTATFESEFEALG